MNDSCTQCKFAIWEDYGYSNWTVEGTDFTCAKGAHPDGTFDRFYKVNTKLAYGKDCPKYEEGEPISMDVEHENVSDLTEEQKVIWEMACGH